MKSKFGLKSIFLLVLTLILALSFTGCQDNAATGDSTTTSAPASTPTAAPTTEATNKSDSGLPIVDKPLTLTIDELHTMLTAFKEKMGAASPMQLAANGMTDVLTGAYGVYKVCSFESILRGGIVPESAGNNATNLAEMQIKRGCNRILILLQLFFIVY